MNPKVQEYLKWLEGLTAGERNEVLRHIYGKAGEPDVRGLFTGSAPNRGRLDEGIFTGNAPNKQSGTTCPTCKRPI